MRLRASLLATTLLFATVTACVLPQAEEETVAESANELAETTGPMTVITDPAAMAHLETKGYSFAERFAGAAAGAKGETLSKIPRYADLYKAVRRDVLAAAARYPAHDMRLPTFGDADKTARERAGGSTYQELNWTWLRSGALRWELTGVVNRFDRRGVPGREATCGEVRLVYRAAYAGRRESSRLPIGMILVFPQTRAADGCKAVAESWIRPAGGDPSLGSWLERGPLAGLGEPISYELNALTDLWSRFVKDEKGVGRHHQYSLRVFRPAGEGGKRLAPEPLANTPDVAMIAGGRRYDDEKQLYVKEPARPKRRAALLEWIAANKAAIMTNSASLGPLEVEGEGEVDLRATQVDAYTAMGLSRVSNRPFTRVFGDDLASFKAALGFGSNSQAQALLRRLDMMTCNGCHVSRSVVGLHLVGEERDYALYTDWKAHAAADKKGTEHLLPTDGERPGNEPPFLARLVANKMAVGISPHLRDERDRRAADLTAFLADGGGVEMPPPDRGKKLSGIYGAVCWAGDKDDPGFGAAAAPEYRCKGGFKCVPVDDEGFGQCIPRYEEPGRSIGDPVELQQYSRNSPTFATVDPFQERGPVIEAHGCITGHGAARENGFPYGGICTNNTGRLIASGDDDCPIPGGRLLLGESGFVDAKGIVRRSKDRPTAGRVVCGASPFGDHVAETWGRMSTAAMIWESVAPGLQIACDDDNPCRDEYVCMRTLPDPRKPDPRKGTCMPGYVLAQLEIDAHRVPGTDVPCIEARGKAVVTCGTP